MKTFDLMNKIKIQDNQLLNDLYARARLTNHLITKGNGTGAKLELVKQAVKEGFDIGIKLLEVEPQAFGTT
jgi:hypothetical protein